MPAEIPQFVIFKPVSVVVVTPAGLVDSFFALPASGRSSIGPTVMPKCGTGVMTSCGSSVMARPSALNFVVVPLGSVPERLAQ